MLLWFYIIFIAENTNAVCKKDNKSNTLYYVSNIKGFVKKNIKNSA